MPDNSTVPACTYVYTSHCVYRISNCRLYLLLYHLSQLLPVSLWSSKEGTVQTSSPSSVDTVIMSIPHCGYTTGQWRVVQPLMMPFMVQCTLFRVEQNTEHPSLEWTMYKHWMDTSSSVHTMYWATSPRAVQSSTPSFLLVSLEIHVHLAMYI